MFSSDNCVAPYGTEWLIEDRSFNTNSREGMIEEGTSRWEEIEGRERRVGFRRGG
jgi:hypothetical protein